MIPHVLTLAAALATAERERDEARAERDTARSALDGLAAAVAKEREAEAAHAEAAVPIDPRDAFASLLSIVEGGTPSPAMAALAAAGEAREAARHAVDALLSDAPAPSAVPAALVREYLDAVDEWERERSAPVARTVARAAMVAARTALDAALAAATTTPTEGHRP